MLPVTSSHVRRVMDRPGPDEARAYAAILSRNSKATPDKSPVQRVLAGDWQFLSRGLRFLLGIPIPLRTRDRWLLERVFLPHFAADQLLHRILFVGCDFYTYHYSRMFRHKTLVTIDPDPGKSRFGAPMHHVATIEDSSQCLNEQSFDLVILNGVLNFGVNTNAQAESALQTCRTLLRQSGQLLLGWSDIPNAHCVDVAAIRELGNFSKLQLPVLNVHHFKIPTAYPHNYVLFQKKTEPTSVRLPAVLNLPVDERAAQSFA